MTRSTKTPRVRICAYCDEIATAQIRPEHDASFYVCADHEERGIIESGDGDIVALDGAARETPTFPLTF